MSDLDAKSSAEKDRLAAVTKLLGGRQTFRRMPQNWIEAHEILLQGLPGKAITYLVRNMVTLTWDATFERAVGMSQRTYQRHATATAKQLNPEQSSRAWKLAEILARASEVFGSKEEAEQWLERPAIGLNQKKPIELLATPAGVELVEDYLVRLEYGVYT